MATVATDDSGAICDDLTRLAATARSELSSLPALASEAEATARIAAASGRVRDALAGMRRLARDLELLVEEQDTEEEALALGRQLTLHKRDYERVQQELVAAQDKARRAANQAAKSQRMALLSGATSNGLAGRVVTEANQMEAAQDITASLRRTRQKMLEELEHTGATLEAMKESDATLSKTSKEYEGQRGLFATSRRLLRTVQAQDLFDRVILWGGLALVLLVAAFIVVKRVGYFTPAALNPLTYILAKRPPPPSSPASRVAQPMGLHPPPAPPTDVVLLDDPRSDEAPPSSRRLVDLPMEDVVGGEVAPDGAAARAEAEEADKARRHAEQDARLAAEKRDREERLATEKAARLLEEEQRRAEAEAKRAAAEESQRAEAERLAAAQEATRRAEEEAAKLAAEQRAAAVAEEAEAEAARRAEEERKVAEAEAKRQAAEEAERRRLQDEAEAAARAEAERLAAEERAAEAERAAEEKAAKERAAAEKAQREEALRLAALEEAAAEARRAEEEAQRAAAERAAVLEERRQAVQRARQAAWAEEKAKLEAEREARDAAVREAAEAEARREEEARSARTAREQMEAMAAAAYPGTIDPASMMASVGGDASSERAARQAEDRRTAAMARGQRRDRPTATPAAVKSVQSTPAAGKEEAEVVAGAVSAAADEVVVDDPAEMGMAETTEGGPKAAMTNEADKNEQGAGAEEPPTGVVTETGDDEAEEDEEEKERRLEERARQRAEVEGDKAAKNDDWVVKARALGRSRSPHQTDIKVDHGDAEEAAGPTGARTERLAHLAHLLPKQRPNTGRVAKDKEPSPEQPSDGHDHATPASEVREPAEDPLAGLSPIARRTALLAQAIARQNAAQAAEEVEEEAHEQADVAEVEGKEEGRAAAVPAPAEAEEGSKEQVGAAADAEEVEPEDHSYDQFIEEYLNGGHGVYY